MMRLATILILIFACAAQAQTMSDNEFEMMLARQAAIDRFVRNAPTFIQSKSLEEFKDIGEIQDEIITTAPNPHVPSKINEFRTLKYAGLEIYGFVRSPKEFWPLQIIVTDPRWKILNDLNVGSSEDSIYKVLGSPTKKTDNIIRYRGETEIVDFSVEEGLISKVVFYYYFD